VVGSMLEAAKDGLRMIAFLPSSLPPSLPVHIFSEYSQGDIFAEHFQGDDIKERLHRGKKTIDTS